jgi:ribosomal protein S18 acetylase RimI-like enzyme
MDSIAAFEIDLLSYSVHRLQPEDAELLQGLFEKCQDYTLLVEGQAVSPTAALDEFQAVPPGKPLSDKFIFGLCGEQGEIVGVLEGICRYPDSTTWWIGLLMLAPEVRGRGVGRQLLQGFSEHVFSNGGKDIMLGVVEDNERACRFWQQMGFTVVRKTEPRQFGKKMQTIYVMRRAANDTGMPARSSWEKPNAP